MSVLHVEGPTLLVFDFAVYCHHMPGGGQLYGRGKTNCPPPGAMFQHERSHHGQRWRSSHLAQSAKKASTIPPSAGGVCRCRCMTTLPLPSRLAAADRRPRYLPSATGLTRAKAAAQDCIMARRTNKTKGHALSGDVALRLQSG